MKQLKVGDVNKSLSDGGKISPNEIVAVMSISGFNRWR